MKPTKIGILVATAIVSGFLGFAIIRIWARFGTPPRVPLSAPLTLVLLAAIVLATALSLRSRLRAQRERQPHAEPINPLAAARAVVLAKASALVGAVVAGIYAGYGIYLLPDLNIEPRRERAIMCGLSVAGSVFLVAAGIFLERVCRIPPPDEGEEDEEEDSPWPNQRH